MNAWDNLKQTALNPCSLERKLWWQKLFFPNRMGSQRSHAIGVALGVDFRAEIWTRFWDVSEAGLWNGSAAGSGEALGSGSGKIPTKVMGRRLQGRFRAIEASSKSSDRTRWVLFPTSRALRQGYHLSLICNRCNWLWRVGGSWL